MISLRNKINCAFNLGRTLNLPKTGLPCIYFSTKSRPGPEFKAATPMKLVFDKDNKATIFKHINGESQLKWLVRGNLFFTMLNAFLFVTETVQPIFGGWNYVSFCLGLGMGIVGTFCLNVFSKRTINEIKLFKTGDYVEVHFFNAYWIPRSKIFHITEFANMMPSYFGLTRSEITSLGKVWINLDKNALGGIPMYDDLVKEVLNGSVIKMSKFDATAAKFQQYKRQ